MWSFSEVIDGIAEACKVFNTPVVSGNVSFYNETEGRGILPTPVIGMLGLIDDVRRVIQPGFKNPGDFVGLLGATSEDLAAASEYAAVIQGAVPDSVPALDLEAERAVQLACLRAAQNGLLRSAHDCSDGGLAVALAECCFSSVNHDAMGADIDLTGEYDVATRLFSETPSRIIISFDQAVLGDIEEIVAAAACPMTLLGNVGSDRLRIESDGEEVIQLEVAEIETAWRSSLAGKFPICSTLTQASTLSKLLRFAHLHQRIQIRFGTLDIRRSAVRYFSTLRSKQELHHSMCQVRKSGSTMKAFVQ
jgi:phosphoribosylformylglycinamidine synthase